MLSAPCACGRSEHRGQRRLRPADSRSRASSCFPPDSPQLKQIRVDPVQLADMPTMSSWRPARVDHRSQTGSRARPAAGAGARDAVMAQLGDTVEQGQPLVDARQPGRRCRDLDLPPGPGGRAPGPGHPGQGEGGSRTGHGPLRRTRPSPRRTCWARRMTPPRPRRALEDAAARPSSRPGASSSFSASSPEGSRQAVLVRAPISGQDHRGERRTRRVPGRRLLSQRHHHRAAHDDRRPQHGVGLG